MNYTRQQILDALSHVQEPDLKQDLVTLNMIEDVMVEGSKVSFTVVLTTPACPLQAMIEKDCRKAIAEYVSPDITVEVKMIARVTTRNAHIDRKSGVSGKRVSDVVDLGGRRILKKKIKSI